MSDSKPQSRSGRDSDLVHPSDPGTEVKEGEFWGVGAAEKTYEENDFQPATEDQKLSYTPARVTKNVYNEYPIDDDDFSVFCYFTDWAQYDERYGNAPDQPPGSFATGGRGADLMWLGQSSFDKIVIGFAAIIGDKGDKEVTINQAAMDFNLVADASELPDHKGELTFTDPWGDVASYINCGFDGWVGPEDPTDYSPLFNASSAQGVLGGLVKLKEAHPEKTIAFSLGGWTMSQAFHSVCQDPVLRTRLVDGLAYILDNFPMFTHIDLDWEYPGSAGAGNDFDEEDADNFALLIQEIKAAYPSIGLSIAVAGDPEKIAAAKIPLLVEAGIDGINLMSYDLFTVGTGISGNIGHHTNLKRDPNDEYSKYSIDDAVNYMLDQGIDPKKIFVGFAGYSRSARQANMTSVSPLTGTYDTEGLDTVGSFESAVTEWPDVIYNYLDLERKTGLEGYVLYTDEVADADFLYSRSNQVFMSIDTPRSVKAKAEYVKAKGLGGLFIWSADQDNGLLTNAACEGLGRTATTTVIEMEPFYFKGLTEEIRGDVPREPECVKLQRSKTKLKG